MDFIMVMWILWGTLGVILLALLMYRGNVTRNEEDQLFLDDSTKIEHEEQDQIVRKAKQIDPVIRIFGGATGLVTLVIVAFYLHDAIKQFQ